MRNAIDFIDNKEKGIGDFGQYMGNEQEKFKEIIGNIYNQNNKILANFKQKTEE